MGKSSQAKGRRAELELVRVLNSYGIPAEPGQAVSYGETPDIVNVARGWRRCGCLNGWPRLSGTLNGSRMERLPYFIDVPVNRGVWL